MKEDLNYYKHANKWARKLKIVQCELKRMKQIYLPWMFHIFEIHSQCVWSYGNANFTGEKIRDHGIFLSIWELSIR